MALSLTDEEQSLLDRLAAEAIVALTTALIAEPSENPGGTEASTVAVLADACRAAGLRVELTEAAPGRPNLVATLDGGGHGPTLLFLGHSDVVPAGTGWSGDPFAARLVDGRLIGRGAVDMKGGLAAIVAAMGALAQSPFHGRIEFVCTADEEAGGLGARAYVTERAAADDVLGCLVAEPTRLRAVHAGRGTANLDIAVTGKAAHSGRPQDGCSAITAAGRVLGAIADDGERLARAPHPELGPATWNVGTIVGGQGVNVVAADCRLGVDRRLLPDEDIAEVAAGLRERIAELGLPTQATVTVTVDSETPAFATALDAPFTLAVGGALTALGLDPVPRVWSAACDAGFLHRDLGIDSIVLGPGDINSQAHQVDESVAVDDLLTAAKLYALIAHRLLR
ncbi:M20 family metallopeptidase [Gordonia crocea]|uniref:Probable succinyl-diaminopimelate desuccinylase n=1 Tax=Gordonia crocea TaxID=589162 RepID=A0A7I9V185_9ACTN|nr:M20 family metallopeptidase [Gordonia crocea]GED99165.1 acetylornithine deacetylase [Gordonia crocea]